MWLFSRQCCIGGIITRLYFRWLQRSLDMFSSRQGYINPYQQRSVLFTIEQSNGHMLKKTVSRTMSCAGSGSSSKTKSMVQQVHVRSRLSKKNERKLGLSAYMHMRNDHRVIRSMFAMSVRYILLWPRVWYISTSTSSVLHPYNSFL
jgi:hypothetical protein